MYHIDLDDIKAASVNLIGGVNFLPGGQIIDKRLPYLRVLGIK